MKRKSYEDGEPQDAKFNGLFSKLHHQPPPPLLHAATSTAVVERENEEEEGSSSGNGHSSDARNLSPEGGLLPPPPDGATIEVLHRPRGRPAGSRNKPKPPPPISKAPPEPSMSPYILELLPGVDIVAATSRFCRKRKIGLSILSGTGAVTNITLRQSSAAPGAGAVTFHGRFDLLSISATILDRSGEGADSAGNAQFTAYVAAGPQGQVVGGAVVAPLMSATSVYLVAGTFSNHTFCRLQNDGDESSGNGGGEDHGEYLPAISGEHCPIGSVYIYN